MRKGLDRVYAVSGVLGILLLVAIGGLTVGQMIARLFGSNIPSADDFATYCMAGAIFFGLAYTYRAGGHVRVLALRRALPAAAGRALEIMCLIAAAALLLWLLWFTQDMIVSSYRINERSIGMIPVPTWIPMSAMFVGVLVLAVAVVDDLVAVLQGGRTSYASEEEKDGLPPVSME